MKRKIVVSMLILIISIICCGCDYNSTNSDIDNNYTSSYEEKYKYEYDITYKKDADDHTPTVYITRYGKRYHRFGYSHAKNLHIVLTVNQAIGRGYTACYYCCY